MFPNRRLLFWGSSVWQLWDCGDAQVFLPPIGVAFNRDGEVVDLGNLCDRCPGDDLNDVDSDGVCGSIDLCPDTVPGAMVDVNGCPPLIPGDFDHDGDVDEADVAAFQLCTSGPTIPLMSGCSDKDFDHDGDVDGEDFAVPQRCASGTDNPADPECELN